MQTNPSLQESTDREICQAIIEQAGQDLDNLEAFSFAAWSLRKNSPKSYQNIRFQDLPLEHQQAIRQALSARIRGEFVKYTFTKLP